MNDPLDEKCAFCQKAISADEYVVNWGSCGPCFDASYEKFLAGKDTVPISKEMVDKAAEDLA